MMTNEKISFIYDFIKRLSDAIPKYDEHGNFIEICYKCGKEYGMHPENCVTSRLMKFGRTDVCWECLKKSE